MWLNSRAIPFSHLFIPFCWPNGRALSCEMTLPKFPKLLVCCVMTLVVNIGDNVELIVKIYCTVSADWKNLERQRVQYSLYVIMDLCFLSVLFLECKWRNNNFKVCYSVFEHCIHIKSFVTGHLLDFSSFCKVLIHNPLDTSLTVVLSSGFLVIDF